MPKIMMMIRRRRRPHCFSWLAAAAAFFFFGCSIMLVESRRNTRLTWINGIGHSMDHMEEGRQYISTKFGGKPVIFCYNPTSMAHDDDIYGYINDLGQAGTHKLGYMTAEVDALILHLRKALADVGKKGLVVHIAHSQGALITTLASKKLLPSEMSRMEVIAFGGAAAVRRTPQTPFRRCMNYYSVNDPLLMVVPQASQALRSGFSSSSLVPSSSPTANHNNNDNNEFCFLAPRVGDPIADHSLFEETYGVALDWEGARFQRLYVSPVHRLARKLSLLCLLLFGTLTVNINAALKTVLRPIVLCCILVWLWTRSTVIHLSETTQKRVIQPIVTSVLKKNTNTNATATPTEAATATS